jgi:hypothetical protein
MSNVMIRVWPESAAGQDGLDCGLFGCGGGDAAAVGLHDAETGFGAKASFEAGEIAGHFGGDVGVDGGGGEALELAVFGENLVAGADEVAGCEQGYG